MIYLGIILARGEHSFGLVIAIVILVEVLLVVKLRLKAKVRRVLVM
jgi:hypothetical protein